MLVLPFVIAFDCVNPVLSLDLYLAFAPTLVLPAKRTEYKFKPNPFRTDYSLLPSLPIIYLDYHSVFNKLYATFSGVPGVYY